MKNIIKTKTLFGASLTALAFSSIFTSTTFAQTCATVSTCEELGYDQAADNCSDQKYLKCPFDNTKYFCSSPKTITSCTSTHTLSSCPTNAACSTCADNGKYKQTGCQFGYGYNHQDQCNITCTSCDGDGYIYATSYGINCQSNLMILYVSQPTCFHTDTTKNTIREQMREFVLDLQPHLQNGSDCESFRRYQLPSLPDTRTKLKSEISQKLQSVGICTLTPLNHI